MIDDLPACLRIPQEERRAAWKGRRLTIQGSSFRVVTPVEEAATKQLRKELAQQEEQKRAARFAALKELRKRK